MNKPKIGFLQDSTGERSSTKLINFMAAACILIMWVVLSIKAGDVIELPDTALYILGMTLAGSGVKQLLDGIFPGKKIEIIQNGSYGHW